MNQQSPPQEFQPVAGVLAVILPGLGHFYLGHIRRGLGVLGGVMGLFLGGMFIGGIDVIDRQEDKWWFVLQAGVGPIAFAVDAVHQKQFKIPDVQGGRVVRRTASPDPSDNPGDQPARNRKSLGRVNEVGSLYIALAGMINAIAVIDALWNMPARRRREGDGGAL